MDRKCEALTTAVLLHHRISVYVVPENTAADLNNCMLQSTLKVDIISVLMFLRARPTSMLKTTTIPRIE